MAQSALTVTAPNPTPPTNFACTGATPPNVPNFTKLQVANPFNLTALGSGANGATLAADGRPQSPYGVNQVPPPYFDDGAAGALTALIANTAALASGTGATSGGTEGTFPGTGTAPFNPNLVGAVPASTSLAHEGAGTEVVVTSPGSRAECPTQQVSVLGNRTTSPNGDHASSLSPTTNPAIVSISPNNIASAVGTQAITVTGTNFTKQSVINVNGVDLVTTFVSATSLTATATKKTTAGTLPYYVKTGGVVQTAPLNWTFT